MEDNGNHRLIFRKTKNHWKSTARKAIREINKTLLAAVCMFLLDEAYMLHYRLLGGARIEEEERENVEQNVTFIFKSFNRQKMAKRLYHSIKAYFPNAEIIIADDSAEPLEIPGAHIIHLPFNSGLSKGLIVALNEVKTEYVMRLDDDLLLAPMSNVHGQLRFLQTHPEVDLTAIQMSTHPEKSAAGYSRIKMNKQLIIPAGTVIDGRIVAYKTSNCFLARTEKLRLVG